MRDLKPATGLSIGVLLLRGAMPEAKAVSIVFDQLNASLDTGSLAGTEFPVSFSYDASQVMPIGDSFADIITMDFALGNATFHRSDIFQGGQVILHNGMLENLMASFQVILPPESPVNNITFGFGGPGAIGYLDLDNQSGSGSFTFASVSVPEPRSVYTLALGLSVLFLCERWGKRPALGLARF
jgi:hypothetical protein